MALGVPEITQADERLRPAGKLSLVQEVITPPELVGVTELIAEFLVAVMFEPKLMFGAGGALHVLHVGVYPVSIEEVSTPPWPAAVNPVEADV